MKNSPSLFHQLLASWRNKKGVRRYIGPKRIIGLLLIVTLALMGRYLQHRGLLSPSALQDYVALNPLSLAVAFVVIYTVAVVTSIPTLAFNLAAGYFWGGILGGLLATTASGLGAMLAFLAARLALGQPLARRFDHKTVSWLQSELEQKNWRFIAFVRINPVFPTGALNYLFGLTSIRFGTYAWATFIFLCPPSIAIAVIGHEAGTLLLNDDTRQTIRTLLLVSGAITALVLLKYGSRLLTSSKKK